MDDGYASRVAPWMECMAKSKSLAFTLNEQEITIKVKPGSTLLSVLRQDLNLTGTKQACDNEGECGACTVLVDGEAVRSCLTPVEKVAGRRVVTIEGLSTGDDLHPVQQAFIDCGAVQCGFCTPGMVLSAKALLDENPEPDVEAVEEALSGNLCRCTGYGKIVEGVLEAAERMTQEQDRDGKDKVVSA